MLKKIFAFGFLSTVTALGFISSPVGAQTVVDLNNSQSTAQIGTANIDQQVNQQSPTVLDVIPGGGPTIVRGNNQQTSGQAGIANVNLDRNIQNPFIIK
jgi:predicted helicase